MQAKGHAVVQYVQSISHRTTATSEFREGGRTTSDQDVGLHSCQWQPVLGVMTLGVLIANTVVVDQKEKESAHLRNELLETLRLCAVVNGMHCY
jgi:hypothetical protein